jgi:hypothetical protein
MIVTTLSHGELLFRCGMPPGGCLHPLVRSFDYLMVIPGGWLWRVLPVEVYVCTKCDRALEVIERPGPFSAPRLLQTYPFTRNCPRRRRST